MTRPLPPPLVALTPGDLDGSGARAFVPLAARAVAAGLRGVMLREGRLGDRDVLDLARALRDVLAAHEGGWLAIHDRAHLVAPAGASAVHLGFRSLPAGAAREVVGADVAIGVSAHAGDGADRCGGADYLVFGPVFDTPSKRGLVAPTGLAVLARWTAAAALPVWAIGGMRPEHAVAVLDAGAAGMAVLGGVFGAPDPAAAAARYLAALGTGKGEP